MTYLRECDRCKVLIRPGMQAYTIHGDADASSQLQLPGGNVPDLCVDCYEGLRRYLRKASK